MAMLLCWGSFGTSLAQWLDSLMDEWFDSNVVAAAVGPDDVAVDQNWNLMVGLQ